MHYETRHEERTASMRNSKRIRPLATHKSQLGTRNSLLRPNCGHALLNHKLKLNLNLGGNSAATPLFPGPSLLPMQTKRNQTQPMIPICTAISIPRASVLECASPL